MLISELKHKKSDMPAHCTKDNKNHDFDEGLKSHLSVKVQFEHEQVIKTIVQREMNHAAIKLYLQLRNARYIETSYEDLFYASEEERLKQFETIVKFVDPTFPKDKRVTLKDTQGDSVSVSTHLSRNQTVENYDEFVQVLKTEYPQYAKYLNESNVPYFQNLTTTHKAGVSCEH